MVLAGVLYRDELVALVTPAGGGSDTAPSRPPLLVEAVAVEQRRAEQRISATDTLQALEAVVITARTRGRVVEIRFQEGSSVAADDALVRLDRTRARAAVNEARARVAETRSDLQRLRDLKTQQFASQSELDQAKQAAPKTNAGPPQTSSHQSLTVRRQTVKTGVRRDGWVEVTEGLEAGQRVVVAGLQGLRDGDRVRTGPPGGAAAVHSQAERSNRQDAEPADGTGGT